MTSKVSKEEKVAKINGRYILYAALIAGAFALFQLFLNKKLENSSKVNESPKVDTVKSVKNSNNIVNQQNSSNANVQIGSDNKK